MESNEIIKALRHCAVNGSTCRECPAYNQDSGCLDRLHAQAAELLEAQQRRIAELEEQKRWIPVTERLPEHSGEYLVFRMGHQLLLNYSEKHRRFNCFDWYSDNEAEELHIDGEYWRNLPEPPKEDV